MLPPTVNPPFNITRASHLVLTSRDLAKARDFYTEVVGLKVSDESATVIHFRGIEERGHHSLTLRHTKARAECECIGFRVFEEGELELLKAHFEAKGLPARFINVPFQGRTLRATDTAGTPVEFTARMKALEGRVPGGMREDAGACALRLDHFQILAPDVASTAAFYGGLGFRVSDYCGRGEHMMGAFLHRKGNPHDLILQEGDGPRLHHAGYVVAETAWLTRAIDAAHRLGFGGSVELGPVRHGHSFRLYLRDPDGHRVALLLPAIQVIDREDDGVRHEAEGNEAWGTSPALSKHASLFTGVASSAPVTASRTSPGKPRGFREPEAAYVAEEPRRYEPAV